MTTSPSTPSELFDVINEFDVVVERLSLEDAIELASQQAEEREVPYLVVHHGDEHGDPVWRSDREGGIPLPGDALPDSFQGVDGAALAHERMESYLID